MTTFVRLRQAAAAPVFEDDEKTRVAHLLNIILLAALAATAISGLITLSVDPHPAPSLVLDAVAVTLYLAGLYLLRRGYVRLISIALSASLWALLTLANFAFGGTQAPSFGGYLLVILVAGLTLGGRAAIGLAGLSLLASGAILYAENHGLLPAPLIADTPAVRWTAQTTYLIAAAILLYIAARSIEDALRRARSNERALAERNRKLQAAMDERERAEAALQRYANRLRHLHQIDRAIQAAHSPESIADVVLHHLRELVPYQHGAVLSFEPEGNQAVVLAICRDGARGPQPGQRFPQADYRWSAERELRPVEPVADLLAGPARDPAAERLLAAGMRSYLRVPLAVKDQLIGVIELGAAEPALLDSEHVQVTHEVAAQLAIAIHQAQLFAAERHRRQVTETLHAASLALTQTLDLDSVLQKLLEYLGQLVPYDSANVMLRETDTRVAVYAIRNQNGQGNTDLASTISFDAGMNPIIRSLLTTRQSVLIPDTREHPGWERTAGGEHVLNWIGVPLVAGGTVIGLYSVDKTEPRFFTQEHLRLTEALAAQAAVAIQHARLYEQVQHHAAELEQRVAERTAELEQQYRRQAALAEIELAINMPHELQAVLDRIAAVTTQLLPASSASVILWDPVAETFFTGSTTVPGQSSRTAPQRVRREGGASRWIVDHRKPHVVPDIREDPFGANPMLAQHGLQAYAGVPLFAEGEALGVLYALDRQPRIYSQEDLDFMTSLASRAAAATTKVRRYEQAQELAALEERQRLARDLHDAVSQTLFSASVIAETLPRLWDRDPTAVREGLQELHQLTRGALAEMRTLLLELRPAALTESDLGDLLRQLTDAVAGRAQVEVELSVEGQRPLPPEVQSALYRIAQESLNNIVKHARASQVQVCLRSESGQVTLQIADNGRGYEHDSVPPGRLGLGIIHERAEAVDATVTIESRPGHGTTVVAVWPSGQERIGHD